MRLVQKLGLAIFAGILFVLSINGFIRVRREVGSFRRDQRIYHSFIARSLAASTAALWRDEGRERALANLLAFDAADDRIAIRWVDGGQPGSAVLPPGTAALGPNQTLDALGKNAAGEDARTMYAPVDVNGVRSGFIEVSESLAAEHRYGQTVILDTIRLAITFALIHSTVSVIAGFFVVGRPIRALRTKARQIGAGDLETPLAIRGKDELRDLADEMNAMCQRLREARDRVASETAARLAMMQQLRHADRLSTMGKLASGVAHELGTPLNVIEARASMIASGEAGDKATDYARVVVEACDRVTRIVRQFLAFARRHGPEKAPVDVLASVNQSLDLVQPLAKKANVALVVRGDASVIEADATQLQQAITNLVVNAVQAMTAPGTVEIAVGTARSRVPADLAPDGAAATDADVDCVVVAIEDHGVGIAADHLDHIFEPFFTTKEVGEGTGLGLSVTYGIVRDHGGWIGVESELGRGSRFTIYLPRPAAAT